MIRMKAKNLLLSIALIMACFCFFACKDTKVKVESISFTEQSISMLVGEEYTPSIKILPSYATDRSYALISGDVTALKVDGGTITALKAVKGVKLKVVSNENQNINDIVTVDIYAEATDLETPTNLKFDGNKFSFTSEDNSSASSYMLKIGEQEIDIGNNTEYSFANITNKSSNVYDTVLTCSVKAIGDGKIFKNSNYSEPISFVKFSSVSNAYVENETLYFDAIKNVSRYDVDILVNSNVVQSKIVNNSTYSEGQLNLSIADLTDSVNGAEYVLRITPSAEGYNGDIDAENIFTSEAVEINYTVVGTVKNVTINDKVISWDFVDNAQNYTVKLYKGSLLLNEYKNITYNYIYVEYEDACEYYCEILANSNQPNTTSGKIYSNRLGFSILDYPQVNIINNTVSWNSVENAEGYLITIKNSLGATLVNKQFVLSNTYDISNFEAGTYNIEVVACGNGHEILSSKASTQATWTILSGLQLKVENKKLYWTDLDENSLNKYHLTFNTNSSETVDVVLKDDNIGSQYSYNEELNQYIYDLSSYNFEPNTYTISVTSLGENNVFDADTNMISITKLAEGSISSLANKQFTINSVESAVGYKIEIYKSTDANLTTPIVTLDSIKSGNKFDLDSSVLDVGKYIAKVLVYGNNKNIFDADNQNLGTTLSFEKLSTPQITVNKDNSKLIIGQIDGAVTYKLFENNADKNITTQEYDLTSLVAGDYIYRAQALGDNATILDSDQTLGENEIKVKKLATPNIDFDKDTMTYTMSCQDEGYVGAYNFTLNNSTVEVKSNQADCASLMASAGEYVAKVHATPVSANAEYHLLIQSASAEYAVSKLAGKCGFEIVDGKLLVTPTSALTETGYGLEVRIENGNSDIILSDFVYQNSRFELDLHDQNYDIVEENIATLLTNPNQYDMFATIYNQDKDVVSSNETQIINKLTVLGRVDDIKRNTQTIEFNVVSNATNYILVINFDGKDTYIDLAGINIAGNGKNVLQIADVIKLMEQNGVQYVAEMSYKIKFVAVSNSAYTLANKGIVDYTFEFLKVPTISIIEMDDNNFKWLVIENDNDKVYMYNIVMQQGEVDQSSYCMRSGSAKTYICLDAMTKIEAGQASILVKSNANEGDYFDSKNAEINVVKLNSSTISINDGLLQWNAVDNAKQYNLTYTIDGAEQTVALKNGSENFAIENGKCIYNFDLLQSGLTDLYLQVDSELVVNNAYYLNSNKGEVLTNIYKLPTVDIQVKKGQIYTEIYKSDFSLVKKIEVYVDNQLLDLDITVENEYITKQDSTDRFSITINPVA
ncbi:MAG: hypothetical protein IJ358_01020, partial [Clostridia bacterium]|nr:hypothetical protein [Clostridia bacterium]